VEEVEASEVEVQAKGRVAAASMAADATRR